MRFYLVEKIKECMIDFFRMLINNKFLATLTLINIFKSDLFRYPDDVLDRYWYGYKNDNLTTLRTLNTINSGPDNDFQLPSTVMRTAITANGTLGGCLLIIIHNTTFTCTLQKLKSKTSLDGFTF